MVQWREFGRKPIRAAGTGSYRVRTADLMQRPKVNGELEEATKDKCIVTTVSSAELSVNLLESNKVSNIPSIKTKTETI